ncbi:MAG: hypothetical protein V4574_13990 [Pseudomonadota bacterium]
MAEPGSAVRKLSDYVTVPRILISTFVVGLLGFGLEKAFGDVAAIGTIIDTLAGFSKAFLATTVIGGCATVIAAIARADRSLAELHAQQAALSAAATGALNSLEASVAQLPAHAEQAMVSYLKGNGEILLRDTIAHDALSVLSIDDRGHEDRYRKAFDHLRQLSKRPSALSPAITFLIERSIESMNDELGRLSAKSASFPLSGLHQVEMSRRYHRQSAKSIEFVDFEPTQDIETAWSDPFKKFVQEVGKDSRIKEKTQTIICRGADLRNAMAASPMLAEQVRFMLSCGFQVYLCPAERLPKLGEGESSWRFEVYDNLTLIRVERRAQYHEDDELDITVSDFSSDRQASGIWQSICAYRREPEATAAAEEPAATGA